MQTVGQILKDARLSKMYTLEEVEKSTKIRKELLEALEADNWNKLPPPTFVRGFIKNYGRFLGLNEEKLLAVFRREFSDKKNPPRIMQAWTNPLDKSKFKLTPTKVLSTIVFCLVATFVIYLWFEYRFLVGAPFLEITSPPDQYTSKAGVVTVTGKTDPEANVSINNQDVQVDLSGNFSQEIKLTESANNLTITATSKHGKSTTDKITVFVKK